MSDIARLVTLVLFGAVMPLTLAGCSSSPPVRYFSLEPVYEVVENTGEERPIVGLGQLRTPNFLFRSQLVTRDRGGELIVHDFKRWSEPLDQAIHRVVAANIDSLLDDMTVVAFPYESLVKPAYRVHGSVERFEGRSLVGHYRYDDEGVEAQEARLVTHGELSGYLRLNSPVETIRRGAAGYEVLLADGTCIAADAVLIAVPANTIEELKVSGL